MHIPFWHLPPIPFWISTQVAYLQRWLVGAWLVPRETAALSAPSVYAMQPLFIIMCLDLAFRTARSVYTMQPLFIIMCLDLVFRTGRSVYTMQPLFIIMCLDLVFKTGAFCVHYATIIYYYVFGSCFQNASSHSRYRFLYILWEMGKYVEKSNNDDNNNNKAIKKIHKKSADVDQRQERHWRRFEGRTAHNYVSEGGRACNLSIGHWCFSHRGDQSPYRGRHFSRSFSIIHDDRFPSQGRLVFVFLFSFSLSVFLVFSSPVTVNT